MNVMVYNFLSYSIEYVKLALAMYAFFGMGYVSGKRLLLTSGLSAVFVGIVSFFFDLSAVPMGYTVLLLIAAAIILKKKINVIYSFIIYLYICLLDMLLSSIIMYIGGFTAEETMNNKVLNLLLNLPVILVILIAVFMKYKRRKTLTYRFSQSYIILFALGGMALALYIASIQLFAFSDIKQNNVKLAAVALSLSSGVFLVIITLLMKNKSQNEHLKLENVTMNRTMESLEEYYLMLLRKEEETKAFRHDFRSHLFCLNNLYLDGKTDEFEKYLSDILNEFSKLKKSTETGNHLVNAIVSDIMGKFPDVTLNWTGFMPDKLQLSSYDLCTIFSNVLKNAFEAAEKSEEKSVEVLARTMGSNLVLTIKNSAIAEPVTMNDKYISSKQEAGHGYGIRNVRECIKQNGGNFTLTFSDGFVTTDILILSAIPIEANVTV